jgi:hypothetical protein
MRLPHRQCCIERIEQGLENRALSQRQRDTRRYAAAQQNSKFRWLQPQPTRLLASNAAAASNQPQEVSDNTWRLLGSNREGARFYR